MLAIVCSTNEGVKALEKYDTEGAVNCNGGLHGIGSSTGKKINGRFVVICLEDLRQVTYMSVYMRTAFACQFFTQLIHVERDIHKHYLGLTCASLCLV
jgi:hypothetical protein